jgi:hypothetical protein
MSQSILHTPITRTSIENFLKNNARVQRVIFDVLMLVGLLLFLAMIAILFVNL